MIKSEIFYFFIYIFFNFLCCFLEVYTKIKKIFSFQYKFFIIQILLSCISLFFLILTRNKPGYIDKDKIKDLKENKENIQINNEININKDFESTPIVNLNLMPFSYCNICQIKKLPLRSHHCKTCQKCVKGFDHHCWILAGCIGENNRLKFIFFLFFQTFSLIYNALGILKIINNIKGDEVLLYLLTFIFSIFCLLSIIFFWVFIYHIYLLISNQTTFEIFYEEKCPYIDIFKFERNKILVQRGITIINNSKLRPFDAGIIKNIYFYYIKMVNNEKDIKWEELFIENIKTNKISLYCCDKEINN